MSGYLRFQTNLRSCRSGQNLGVFRATQQLETSWDLSTANYERLREALDWFNTHLTVPYIRSRYRRCVFWFKADAESYIWMMWDLVSIFEEVGLYVEWEWTKSPGMIVYEDEYQVAAVPHSTAY